MPRMSTYIRILSLLFAVTFIASHQTHRNELEEAFLPERRRLRRGAGGWFSSGDEDGRKERTMGVRGEIQSSLCTEVGRAFLIHFQKVFLKKVFLMIKIARELKFHT